MSVGFSVIGIAVVVGVAAAVFFGIYIMLGRKNEE